MATLLDQGLVRDGLLNSSAKGSRAELEVWKMLEDDGWLVASRRRGARQKKVEGRDNEEQPGDLLATKDGERPMLIEVKAGAGSPYENFRPPDRARLRELAKQHNVVPMLAFRKNRCAPVLIDETAWPM